MSEQLPPVGSLWLHRESGERRLFLDAWDSPLFKVTRVQFLSIADGKWTINTVSLADWLAWQANAERIDKEQA